MSASKNYPFRPRLDGTFIVDGYNNPYFCFKTKTKRKGGSTIRRSYAPVSYEQIIA